MVNIYLSKIFGKDTGTKEIVKSYFNSSYEDFYDHLESYLYNFHPQQSLSLGKHLFKCDFSPPKYTKGKRNSYRLIVAFIQVNNLLIPVKIYKKSQLSNISKIELSQKLDRIYRELNL